MATIVTLGHGKDVLGFPCTIQECTQTGKRYLAYTAEVWFERAQHIQILQSLGKEVPQDDANRLSLEVEDVQPDE